MTSPAFMAESALAFIALLTVLVVIHEGGHFLVARLFGVTVLKFRVGFGRPLVRHVSRRTGTEYGIGWLPLGGFVEPYSRHAAPKVRESSPPAKAKAMEDIGPWKRLAILFAGPFMNGVLALMLFAGLAHHGRIAAPPLVGSVQQGGWAWDHGVRPGDRFLSVNGHRVSGWPDVFSRIIDNIGDGRYPVTLRTRAGQVRHVQFNGDDFHLGHNQTYVFAGKGLGIMPFSKIPKTDLTVIRPGWLASAAEGWKRTLSMSAMIFVVVGKMLAGKISTQALSGPIAIAQVSSKALSMGWLHYLFFGAIFSVNLMVMNFFPIPGLDGGGMVLTLAEIVRRKPIDPEHEKRIVRFGYAILIALFIFVVAQDIYFFK